MPGFSFYRGVFGGHKSGGVRVFVGVEILSNMQEAVSKGDAEIGKKYLSCNAIRIFIKIWKIWPSLKYS